MGNLTIEVLQKHQQLVNEVLQFENIMEVIKPATVNDGIARLNKYPRKRFLKKFHKLSKEKSFRNFILCYEGSTDMFQKIIRFASEYNIEQESFSSYVNRTRLYDLKEFFLNLRYFPFYECLSNLVSSDDYIKESHDQKKISIAKYLIEEKEIHLKPKALQAFHTLKNGNFSAMHQQYKLHQRFASSFNSSVLHLTIDKTNKASYVNELAEMGVDEKVVELCYQTTEDDALCLNSYNDLYLKSDGSPLKMASGHGALLANLNDMISTDVIHIHNIDSIPHDRLYSQLINEKKILMGYLFFIEEKVHRYLRLLEQDKLSKKRFKKFVKFCKKHLQLDFNEYLLHSKHGKRLTIYHFLNRPIRVCAMVPTSTGNGDAPFWVNGEDSRKTLQIVASNELENNIKATFNATGTHSNPVELFCTRKDYKGENFNFLEYSNQYREMLKVKNFKGDAIKYIESPGLWTGGMHNWLTVFVEMSERFYNPVKSVNDLLRDNHQESQS